MALIGYPPFGRALSMRRAPVLSLSALQYIKDPAPFQCSAGPLSLSSGRRPLFADRRFFHIAPSQRIRAAARAGLSIRFAYDGRKHTDIILFAAAVL